jgi:hypothetical protein
MTPLIYTSRGNIPESETTYTHEWFDGPDMTILIKRDADGRPQGLQ